MQIFKQVPNVDFLGQRKFWLSLSLGLSILIFVWPLVGHVWSPAKPNWGVDFAGGSEMQVQFTGPVDPVRIRKTLDAGGIADTNVQQFGEAQNHEFLVRVRQASLFTNQVFEKEEAPKLRAALPGLKPGKAGISYNADQGDQVTVRAGAGTTLTKAEVGEDFAKAGFHVQDVRVITQGTVYSVLLKGVSDKVERSLSAAFPKLKPATGTFIRKVDTVGASVGHELKIAAIKALLLSIALILLYIGFRFDFAFATGAVVALLHDAIIVTGYYLLSHAELNTDTIAAVLTVVGYSVNDTVIIYDRIRENLQKHKGRDLVRVMNESINETLSRTIITHFTVLLSLMGLLIFTVGTLREFAFAMVVGVITGTYSSVYIASPITIWISDVMKARKERLGGSGPAKPRLSDGGGKQRRAAGAKA